MARGLVQEIGHAQARDIGTDSPQRGRRRIESGQQYEVDRTNQRTAFFLG